MAVPHHKKGDKFLVGNYRPVCHLIELGKLVELVVWDQLLQNCIVNKLIHPNHHGLMSNHDRVTVVGHLQDIATRAADCKKLSAIIMLDQTAAYDLVVYGVLL